MNWLYQPLVALEFLESNMTHLAISAALIAFLRMYGSYTDSTKLLGTHGHDGTSNSEDHVHKYRGNANHVMTATWPMAVFSIRHTPVSEDVKLWDQSLF